jgi:hypothetical protein
MNFNRIKDSIITVLATTIETPEDGP